MTVKGLFLYYLDNLWIDLRILIISCLTPWTCYNLQYHGEHSGWKTRLCAYGKIETVMLSD